MRLIGVSMVSNEADMIEAFVRHNLGFLDALAVLDHMSIDRTPEILRSLAQEGLPLAVLRDNERAFKQGERQTWLARRYLVEWQADFCFALDADELIACESRTALENALAALPAGGHGLVPLRNYFGIGDATQTNPVARLTRRMRVERKQPRKVVLGRAFADDPANQVSFGNHAAIRVEAGRVTPLPHQPLDGLTLAHFPLRSPEQLAKKALLGWLSWRLTQPERFMPDPRADGAPSEHWRRMFDLLAAGGSPSDDTLMRDAIVAYAGGERREPVADDELIEDPLPCRYEMRYTRPSADTALALLARWTEQLVSEMNARSGENAPRGTATRG